MEQNLVCHWWYLFCTVKKDEGFDLCSKACGGFKFLTCIYGALLMMAYQNYVSLLTCFCVCMYVCVCMCVCVCVCVCIYIYIYI